MKSIYSHSPFSADLPEAYEHSSLHQNRCNNNKVEHLLLKSRPDYVNHNAIVVINIREGLGSLRVRADLI